MTCAVGSMWKLYKVDTCVLNHWVAGPHGTALCRRTKSMTNAGAGVRPDAAILSYHEVNTTVELNTGSM